MLRWSVSKYIQYVFPSKWRASFGMVHGHHAHGKLRTQANSERAMPQHSHCNAPSLVQWHIVNGCVNQSATSCCGGDGGAVHWAAPETTGCKSRCYDGAIDWFTSEKSQQHFPKFISWISIWFVYLQTVNWLYHLEFCISQRIFTISIIFIVSVYWSYFMMKRYRGRRHQNAISAFFILEVQGEKYLIVIQLMIIFMLFGHHTTI